MLVLIIQFASSSFIFPRINGAINVGPIITEFVQVMENLESHGISLSVLKGAAAIFACAYLFIYHAILNKN